MDSSGLGAAIRAARREAGLTQRRLAEMAGTDQPTVSDAERGKAGQVLYGRLARALGLRLVVSDAGAEIERVAS